MVASDLVKTLPLLSETPLRSYLLLKKNTPFTLAFEYSSAGIEKCKSLLPLLR